MKEEKRIHNAKKVMKYSKIIEEEKARKREKMRECLTTELVVEFEEKKNEN